MSQKKTKSSHRFYPFALTVGCSDSCGAAGIQADLRTFNAFGVYGASVVTAFVQDGGRLISQVSPQTVQEQFDAVIGRFIPGCIKCGMPADENVISIIAKAVDQKKLKLVCDPAAGAFSADGGCPETFKNELLPRAEWITPGIAEAELLLENKIRITGREEFFEAARLLAERFDVSVLLRGGDALFSETVDAVVRGGRTYALISPRAEVPASAARGVGDTFSAALAAGITLDYPWKQALCEAESFVLGSLSQNVELASGVFAMYPPTEDCYDLVKLEPVN